MAFENNIYDFANVMKEALGIKFEMGCSISHSGEISDDKVFMSTSNAGDFAKIIKFLCLINYTSDNGEMKKRDDISIDINMHHDDYSRGTYHVIRLKASKFKEAMTDYIQKMDKNEDFKEQVLNEGTQS
jgi:hypothetical protein